jgi:hypothetical protein
MSFGRAFLGGAGWYSGAGVSLLVPQLLPVAIGNHAYLIEPTLYQRRTLPSLRPPQDTQPEPGEVSLNNEGLWRRSQSNWDKGAGQIMFDEADSLRTRFFASKGLDPHAQNPSQRYTLRMLPDTRNIRTSVNTNLKVLAVGAFLYVADGQELYWTADPTVASPAWTSTGMSVAGQNVLAVTCDGAYVYCALGSAGVRRTAIGSGSSAAFLVASHTVTNIGYGNGRLLCANGNQLNEVNATGQFNGDPASNTLNGAAIIATNTITLTTLTVMPPAGAVLQLNTPAETAVVLTANAGTGVVTLTANLLNGHANASAVTWSLATGLLAYTHPNPAMVFAAITPTPHGLFVAGNAGDRAEAYRLAVDTVSGALAAPVSVMALPNGETLNSMQYYGGAMALATSRGIRVASVTIVFNVITLAYGPVILIPGGCNQIAGLGEFVWFTWSNFDASSTGLGKANLADFAAPLTPSYSSDIMAGTTGAGIQGTVLSVDTFNGHRYFAVSGVGIFGEHPTNFVPVGWFSTGRIKFGTTEQKLASSISLLTDPLPAGASVQTTITNEDTDVFVLPSFNTAGAIRPLGLISAAVDHSTEQLTITFTLTRGTTPSAAPLLRRWTLRALVVAERIDEILCPIILEERVMTQAGAGRMVEDLDPLTEFQYLKSLEATKRVVRYQEGDASYNVYVDAVEIDKPKGWSPNHHRWFQTLVTVRMLTVP